MKTSICLNMIVKNETAVLGRLFASLKHVIDYYVIVDTGSTDGTPDFIKSEMARYGIEGKVYEHEWVNFGFNRNQALQYVYEIGYQGWVLFIDADEELGCSNPHFYQHMQLGISYQLEKHNQNLRYRLPNLVDVSQTKWQWSGVVHEYLEHLGGPYLLEPFSELWIIVHLEQGARSQGVTSEQKFLRDAALLEAECQRQPNDARSRFYLAQSYHHADHFDRAHHHYQLRAKMPGWIEETFVAQLRVGHVAIMMNKPDEEIVQAFLTAYKMRPSRAEPLHDLAAWYRQKEAFLEAHQYAKQAAQLPYPADTLFVDKDIYDWRILDELAVAAYWVGRYGESKAASETILAKAASGEVKLDPETVQRIRDNLGFALAKLAESPITLEEAAQVGLSPKTTANVSDITPQILNRIPYLSCPLCDSVDYTEVTVADCTRHPLYQPSLPKTQRWLACLNCGHLYVDGYFSQAALTAIFSDTNQSQMPGYDIENQRYIWAHVLDIFSNLRPMTGGRWLDVGFGNGSLLTTAAEFGYQVVGLDSREDSVHLLQELGFEAYSIHLEEYQDTQGFDVISMADVLEHIPYPKNALRAAWNLLRPDSFLFLSMPNIDSFIWQYLTKNGINPYWGELEHYHNFGRKRLYALLVECGFEPVRYGVSTRYRACMEVIARKVG